MTADILLPPCCSTSMQMSSSTYEFECSQNLNCRALASLSQHQKQQLQQQLKNKLKLKQQEQAHHFQQQCELEQRKQQEQEALERERKQREIDENAFRQRLFECASTAVADNTAQTADVSAATTTTASSTNCQHQPILEPSANSNNNSSNYGTGGGSSSSNSNSSSSNSNVRSHRNYDTAFVRNTVAQALITRLQKWCCQLFWLTIVCVIGCCGDRPNKKTVAEVRRDIFNNSMRRCKDLNELEVQLLRRLTTPQSSTSTVMMRPLRAQAAQRKRHAHLSRPPSPQLFAIAESEDEEELE